MVAVRSLLALTGAVLVVLGCTAPGAPSSSPASSPSASAAAPIDRIPVMNSVSRDGVTLTLQIDAGRVAAGDAVRLIASVTNTQPGVVMWQGGGCDLLGNLLLKGPAVAQVPLPDPPQGEDPASITGLIRWAALASSGGGPSMFVPPNLPPGAAFGCTADLRVNELAQGQIERIEAIWHGRTGDGLPAPAGAYSVQVSFPFLTRQAAPPFEGDPIADAKPIVLEVPYEVVGAPWQGLSAAEALDIALADGRIQAWIAGGLKRTEVGGARVTFEDGGVWRIEVDVQGPTGDTAGVTLVEVHPETGAVMRVEIPTG
jgi:hypothetical protein